MSQASPQECLCLSFLISPPRGGYGGAGWDQDRDIPLGGSWHSVPSKSSRLFHLIRPPSAQPSLWEQRQKDPQGETTRLSRKGTGWLGAGGSRSSAPFAPAPAPPPPHFRAVAGWGAGEARGRQGAAPAGFPGVLLTTLAVVYLFIFRSLCDMSGCSSGRFFRLVFYRLWQGRARKEQWFQSPEVNHSWKNFWLNPFSSPKFHRNCSLGRTQPK